MGRFKIKLPANVGTSFEATVPDEESTEYSDTQLYAGDNDQEDSIDAKEELRRYLFAKRVRLHPAV